MDCEKEQESCHHLGAGAGNGPVQASETVLVGFCEQDLLDGKPLKQAFPGKRLKKGDFSLARTAFIDKEKFTQYVVEPQKNSTTPIISVGRASVLALRGLTTPLDWQSPIKHIRSICVLDRVGPLDHDSHAALQYCEEQTSLLEGQLKRVRAHIAADLAKAFSNALPLDKAFGV